MPLASSALVAALSIFAQSPQTQTATTTDTVEAPGLLDDWVLLPVIFYTPETRLGFGGMAVYTFDGPDNVGKRRSNMLFRAFYTLEKQTSFFIEPNLWMFDDFFALTGWYEWRNYPFKFFGIGNEPNFETPDVYTEKVFEAVPQATFRLMGSLRGGFNMHVLGGTLKDYPVDGLLVQNNAQGLDDTLLIGVGPTLNWDTRDSNFWPKAGTLINLDLTVFNKGLGSDFSFTRVTGDVRAYKELWLGHVLSAQGYFRLSDGNVPFIMLPRLGGTRRHRGWFEGSLRDQHVYLGQVEYRAPIYGRWGLVAFASLGQAMSRLGDISLSKAKGAVGTGVRFRLNDEGVNIRLDFAWGENFNFYFQVGEAF